MSLRTIPDPLSQAGFHRNGLLRGAWLRRLQSRSCSITPVTTPAPGPSVPASLLSFAYVENVLDGSISMYKVTADGHWVPTSPATVPSGTQPESLVVHPSGHYVYVPNIRDNNIAMFRVDTATGLLTPLAQATVPTGALPQYIVMDPLGRFAYTADSNDNTLSMYTVENGTGLLRPTQPAAIATSVDQAVDDPTADPISLAIDPKGRFLYSCNGAGSVTSYRIDQATGVLTPTGPGPVREVGGPFSATLDPAGQFLYVTDRLYNRVRIFAVDQTTGALTPGNQPELSVGQEPTSVVVEPTGHFAYVVNRQDNNVSQFSRNPTDGSLTPLTPATIYAPSQPWQMYMDPSGQLAYLSEEASNRVMILAIGKDGRLSQYGFAPTASVPGGIGPARVQ